MYFSKAELDCCSCEMCGKTLSLITYYSQDGVCGECFKIWIMQEDTNGENI